MTSAASFSSSNSSADYRLQIVWRNVIILSLVHFGAVYGLYLILVEVGWPTIAFGWLLSILSGCLGVTCGAHRMWSHKAFKARWPLRLVFAVFQTIALQNDIFEWCRDHRTHHKWSETDADPHNATRGFFFAHMGWLLCRKHPEVMKKGKTVDMSDVWSDPIVRFQRRFYLPFVTIFWLLIPIWVPSVLFGESRSTSFFTCVLFRYVYGLHSTWLVNSAAHLWGPKPYDKTIGPVENRLVAWLSLGEGYHNYHHTFPWDYSASELSCAGGFNFSTLVIDLLAWFGWVYELKKPTEEAIRKRVERTGDLRLLTARRGGFKLATASWIMGLVHITWIFWFVAVFRLLVFRSLVL